MSFLKKFIFSLCMVTGMCIALAIPCFAEDVHFYLTNYPTGHLVNTTQKQSYSVVWQNPAGEYFYSEIICDRNRDSYLFGTNFFLSPMVVKHVANNYNITYDDYFLLPCFQGVNLSSGGNTFNMEYIHYAYRPNGTLASDPTQYYIRPQPTKTTPFTFGGLAFGVSASESNYKQSCWLADGYRFFVIDYPTYPISEVTDFSSHIPSDYDVCVDSSYRNYVYDAWDGTQSSCTITDNIYINDTLVYSPASNGNIATHIIANGVGALTPNYDENGNITNYTFDVTVDSDYSPIFEYRPEYDVPGLEFDYSSDIPNVEFTQNQLTNLSVMDGGSALTWFYARLNDVAASNVKILALMTSCLSLGFITLMLNKRV